MYRRSVITDEISQDLDDVLDVARAFHLDGLEIRTVWNTRVDLLSNSQVSELRAAVDAAGLVIAAVAPPFYKCDVDSPDERAQHLEILKRAIDVGERLGTHLVRTFTFWRKYPLEKIWARLIDAYAAPIEIARASGALLAIENEYACHVGTGRELARFVAELAQPQARSLWDPCNAFFVPDAERPFPDGYQAVRDQIVHVHLKDAARPNGSDRPSLTPVGEGDLDVRGQLAALANDGYTRFVSLETHWRPAAPLAEATVRLPGGRVFSENAAAATIRCLQNWDNILQTTG